MPEFVIENEFPLENWAQMEAFLAATYGPGYIMRDRALFEWQFRHPQRADMATVLCAYRAGELVGTLGYMPTDLLWGSTSAPVGGAWMANWMVRDEYRVGIGWILMRRMQELFPVVLGQGGNAANEQLAAKLGFLFHHEIPRRVAVFDPGACEAFFAGPLPPEQRAELIGVRWHSTVTPTLPCQWVNPETYDPDWSRLSWMQFGTLRDLAYLRYRYGEHPVFDYDVSVSGPPREPAVCVSRVEVSSGMTEQKVGRVVELFCPQSAAGRAAGLAVLTQTLEALRADGCAYADFFCSSGFALETAEAGGMCSLPRVRLPHRLNPVEASTGTQNLELWASPNHQVPPALEDLYVTKSDGDQDRPSR